MSALVKDDLPPELTPDEWAALKATAMRGKLPAALTPSELAALAYPDAQAVSDRKALLIAICEALEAGELEPARPPKTLADLHPCIAARWKDARPPFNPTVSVLLWFMGEDYGAREIESGFPRHNFSIPVARESFLAWARTLPIDLPGASVIRSRSPDDTDKARSQSVAVLAELQRLPAWLTREELLSLWATVEHPQTAAARSAKATANRLRLDEGLRSGRLPHHRAIAVAMPTDALPPPDAERPGWHSARAAKRRPAWEDTDLPPMPASTGQPTLRPAQIWLHRDDFDDWVRGELIGLPADCLLRYWWPWKKPEPEPQPRESDSALRRKRSIYGRTSHATRRLRDWRALIAEAEALMAGQGMTRSDAARRVARAHKLTGCDGPRLSGQTKTLANKLGNVSNIAATG